MVPNLFPIETIARMVQIPLLTGDSYVLFRGFLAPGTPGWLIAQRDAGLWRRRRAGVAPADTPRDRAVGDRRAEGC